MKRFLRALLSAIISLIMGSVLAATIFITSIGIYAEFIMPDIVGGATVGYDIARGFGLETSQLDCLVDRKILTSSEVELFESDSMVRRDVVWRTILPTYGVYPYPANIYVNLPFPATADTPADQPYLDARVAAIACGLATTDDNPEEYMTQKEYDMLIAKLETGTIHLPDYNSGCPYLTNQTWTAKTYRGRNSLMVGWKLIPSSWREDFLAQSWNIDFTLPSTIQSETGEVSRHTTAGVTNYQTKTISLDTSDPSTTIHEFAHYVAYRVGWLHNADFEADYTAEAPSLASLLGTYSQTTPREYFAEFVSYWLLHPESQSRLRTLAPKTSIWVEHIISDFPLLVPSLEAP